MRRMFRKGNQITHGDKWRLAEITLSWTGYFKQTITDEYCTWQIADGRRFMAVNLAWA